MERPIKIAYVITGLGVGGAEVAFCQLVERLDRKRFAFSIISLAKRGAYHERVEQCASAPIKYIGMSPTVPTPAAYARLRDELVRVAPDIVHTWMSHANVVGTLAARSAGLTNIIWSIFNLPLSWAQAKKRTLAVNWVGHRLAPIGPKRIVFPAVASERKYFAIGYPKANATTIHAGFDTELFRASPDARVRIRHELGIPDNAIAIGLSANFVPLKNHRLFLEAAGKLRRVFPNLHFVMCGRSVDPSNRSLEQWMKQFDLGDEVHRLGMRTDMPDVLAALDIATLTSSTEAFPAALGEAMATGIPCVATDVGDCGLLIGDTGRLVRVDVVDFAGAVAELVELGTEARRDLGARARARILKHYSLERMTTRYQALYDQMAPPARACIAGAV